MVETQIVMGRSGRSTQRRAKKVATRKLRQHTMESFTCQLVSFEETTLEEHGRGVLSRGGVDTSMIPGIVENIERWDEGHERGTHCMHFDAYRPSTIKSRWPPTLIVVRVGTFDRKHSVPVCHGCTVDGRRVAVEEWKKVVADDAEDVDEEEVGTVRMGRLYIGGYDEELEDERFARGINHGCSYSDSDVDGACGVDGHVIDSGRIRILRSEDGRIKEVYYDERGELGGNVE
jgi:hypothetical protein